MIRALCVVVVLALAGCATPAPSGISTALLSACLDLPQATPPKTNGELLDGFLVAREGHEVCRATVESLGRLYGNKN